MANLTRQIDHDCISHALKNFEALRGRWAVPILCVLLTGSVRLGELRKLMPNASKKGLTSALRSLERMKLITSRDLSKLVLHVKYELVAEARTRLTSFLDKLAEFPNEKGNYLIAVLVETLLQLNCLARTSGFKRIHPHRRVAMRRRVN